MEFPACILTSFLLRLRSKDKKKLSQNRANYPQHWVQNSEVGKIIGQKARQSAGGEFYLFILFHTKFSIQHDRLFSMKICVTLFIRHDGYFSALMSPSRTVYIVFFFFYPTHCAHSLFSIEFFNALDKYLFWLRVVNFFSFHLDKQTIHVITRSFQYH